MQCANFPDLERMKKTYLIKSINIDLNLFQFEKEEIEVMTELNKILNALQIKSQEYNYLLVMLKGYY
jgi:hypothetical protein